jgi:hypothetical protein
MDQLELQQRAKLRALRAEERRIRANIKERKSYFVEQELAIQQMTDLGNNSLRNLLFEEAELTLEIGYMKDEILKLNETIVNKRFELIMLGKL